MKIEYENVTENVSKYAEHVSMYKVGGGAGADGVSRESWAAEGAAAEGAGELQWYYILYIITYHYYKLFIIYSGAAAEGAGDLQWSRWLVKMVIPWSGRFSDLWT